jgi:hypothetical protein
LPRKIYCSLRPEQDSGYSSHCPRSLRHVLAPVRDLVVVDASGLSLKTMPGRHNRHIAELLKVNLTYAEHAKTEIMGSNFSEGMDICVRLFYVCLVLCDGLIPRPSGPTDCV